MICQPEASPAVDPSRLSVRPHSHGAWLTGAAGHTIPAPIYDRQTDSGGGSLRFRAHICSRAASVHGEVVAGRNPLCWWLVWLKIGKAPCSDWNLHRRNSATRHTGRVACKRNAKAGFAEVTLLARMKRNTSQSGASHNPAAAGERAEVLTGHVSAETECAIVGNVRANNTFSCRNPILPRRRTSLGGRVGVRIAANRRME